MCTTLVALIEVESRDDARSAKMAIHSRIEGVKVKRSYTTPGLGLVEAWGWTGPFGPDTEEVACLISMPSTVLGGDQSPVGVKHEASGRSRANQKRRLSGG